MTLDSMKRKYEPRQVIPKEKRQATLAMIASLASEGYDIDAILADARKGGRLMVTGENHMVVGGVARQRPARS